MNEALWFSLLCAGLALVYGIVSVRWILAKPTGNERMQAIAAAVLGDAGKVEYKPTNAEQRFPALQSGEVDVLSRNTTWTLSRGSSAPCAAPSGSTAVRSTRSRSAGDATRPATDSAVETGFGPPAHPPVHEQLRRAQSRCV